MKNKLQKMLLPHAKIFLLGIALQLILVSTLVAQGVNVTGIVTSSEDGEALPGVNVVIKGTTQGTVTDVEGNYALEVPGEKTILVMSSVGFVQEEVLVGKQSVINMSMVPDITSLDEIVVIGYGTASRRDITGSIASISADEIIRTPVTDIGQALQGKLAGVHVTTQDGRPGGEVSIRVRGGGSITGSNQPLFIVDGFPVSSISDISANLIESIDVLKDASSTAIYGSRGANGVVIVTTKSGKVGKTTVTYDNYMQWNTVPEYIPVMDSYDYIGYNWGYAKAIGDQYSDAWEKLWLIGPQEGSNSAGIDHYRNVDSRDYMRELYSNSFTHNHNVSISSGTENTKYMFSVNHIDDQGLKSGSEYQRSNLQFNLDQALGKKVSLSINTRYSQTQANGNDGDYTSYYFRPIATEDVLGELDATINTQLGDYDDILQDASNPEVMINDQKDIEKKSAVVMNTALSWDIIEGLTAKTVFDVRSYHNKVNRWDGAISGGYTGADGVATFGGDARIKSTEGWNYRWANTLTYDVQGLSDRHNLSVLAGMEVLNSGSEWQDMRGERYPVGYDSERAWANMGDYDKDPEVLSHTIDSEIGTPYRLNSYFGRVQYTLDDKYLFSGTVRTDGSSKFAEDYRWGTFPSASVAWRMSNENFLQNVGWLSDLKVRAAYGQVGNDNIKSTQFRQMWETKLDNWSIDENRQPTYIPEEFLARPDLRWETTTTRDIGIDFSLLKGRLNGTFDWYLNTVDDLLLVSPLSPVTGFAWGYENIGSTSNTGIELALSYDIIQTKDFNLRASMNMNVNKNNIESLNGEDEIFYAGVSGGRHAPRDRDYILEVGQPIGRMRGWVHEGWYTTDDFDYDPATEIYTLKAGVADWESGIMGNIYGTFDGKPGDQTAYPGVQKVKDTNGDGVVTEDDIVILGDVNPANTGGFNLGGNYKNFDFNVDFIWAYDYEVVNQTHMEAYKGGKEDGLYRNRFQELAGHYKIYDIVEGQLEFISDPAALDALNANATTYLPYAENTTNSTFGIEDASFLRLNSVSIGYSLPTNILDKIGLERVRVYGSIVNAYTWTNYSGMDPEVNTDPHEHDYYPTPGIDQNAYPRPRKFTLGLNIQF